jgi:hypothetical protein
MRSSRVLERLTANAEVATVLVSIPHSSILRHSGTRGAADETVLIKVPKNPKTQNPPLKENYPMYLHFYKLTVYFAKDMFCRNPYKSPISDVYQPQYLQTSALIYRIASLMC